MIECSHCSEFAFQGEKENARARACVWRGGQYFIFYKNEERVVVLRNARSGSACCSADWSEPKN